MLKSWFMSLKAREALGFSRPTVRPRCVVADSDEVEWCVCGGAYNMWYMFG